MTRAFAHVLAYFTVATNRLQDRKDRGATAVEYGLLVGLIAIAIIVAVTALGTQLDRLFDRVVAALTAIV